MLLKIKKFTFTAFLYYMLLLPSYVIADNTEQIDLQKEEVWELCRFNFYFENDMFSATDSQYSSGEKFNWFYHVDNPSNPLYNFLFTDSGYYSYANLAIVNQIYTPVELDRTDLIKDDRPYAGWTYLEYGIHKSSSENLRSFYIHVGMVGPASKSEQIQKAIHDLTGSEPPMGWDNQLKNEFGINLRYVHKWRLTPPFIGNLESSVIPFIEAELGNIAINATAGVGMRFGWNIPKDFAVSTLDAGGEIGVLVGDEHKNSLKREWSFSFNISGYTSAVARDIFLDGNTFRDSHSVDKENLVFYMGAGFSARYKNFMIDFIQTRSTPKFKLENRAHTVGTAIVSWLY
ncbi:MAG: lipid A deacylase LpxR family protein [Campylobacterota bacterium]